MPQRWDEREWCETLCGGGRRAGTSLASAQGFHFFRVSVTVSSILSKAPAASPTPTHTCTHLMMAAEAMVVVARSHERVGKRGTTHTRTRKHTAAGAQTRTDKNVQYLAHTQGGEHTVRYLNFTHTSSGASNSPPALQPQ